MNLTSGQALTIHHAAVVGLTEVAPIRYLHQNGYDGIHIAFRSTTATQRRSSVAKSSVMRPRLLPRRSRSGSLWTLRLVILAGKGVSCRSLIIR